MYTCVLEHDCRVVNGYVCTRYSINFEHESSIARCFVIKFTQYRHINPKHYFTKFSNILKEHVKSIVLKEHVKTIFPSYSQLNPVLYIPIKMTLVGSLFSFT